MTAYPLLVGASQFKSACLFIPVTDSPVTWPGATAVDLVPYTNTSSNTIYDILELNVNYQNIDESRNSRKLNAASLKSQVENIKIFGGAINLRKNFNKNELDYGLDFSYHDVTSKATFTNNIRAIISTIKNKQYLMTLNRCNFLK